ncbi:efflux RND transporter periplasmic adaptor subunit [Brenneria sp. 4F2]|nr:efflux RND transporter periplasmic adaptor subunit [Brenneria bubanii]
MRLKTSLLVMSLCLTACDGSTPVTTAPAPAQVCVVTLQTQPITLSSRLPGRTTAIRRAEVRPQVDGIILKQMYKEGADVKAGQQLYQIDDASYQAAYDKALATLNNANAVVKRYRPLVAAKAISAQVYDAALSDAAQAKADVETARVNLEYTRVKAPISGHIGRSLFTEGALVTSGQTSYLTTISQLDPIYVDVSESSRKLLQLRRALADGKLKAVGNHAAAARLTLEDGSAYSREGQLEFSEVTVNEGTGTVTMRASFPNPDKALLPGMFVHAIVPQGVQDNGIMAPQQAISHDSKGKPYVYLVKADNTVEQRTITTGDMINGKWLVTSGLAAGEKVITSGLQHVQPGSTVSASEQPQDTSSSVSDNNLSMTDASAQ